jgi:hypothetical protein
MYRPADMQRHGELPGESHVFRDDRDLRSSRDMCSNGHVQSNLQHDGDLYRLSHLFMVQHLRWDANLRRYRPHLRRNGVMRGNCDLSKYGDVPGLHDLPHEHLRWYQYLSRIPNLSELYLSWKPDLSKSGDVHGLLLVRWDADLRAAPYLRASSHLRWVAILLRVGADMRRSVHLSGFNHLL